MTSSPPIRTIAATRSGATTPRWNATTPGGFAIWLAIGIAALLIGVGYRVDTLPFRPGATFSDAVISHWPNALFLQRSLQAGEFPLWRPLLMSGQPFAANPLSKV